MLDLELLRSFVSVVDSGSFTRAGERVHRTQSTVSQQIHKLEDAVGRSLLRRDRTGKNIAPTEEGEVLLGYARRLLALADEAATVLSGPTPVTVLRLGVPEDFAARRLTDLLSGFARAHPGVRLDTTSGLSSDLTQGLATSALDLALVKRDAGRAGDHRSAGGAGNAENARDAACLAHWPERIAWVRGRVAWPSREAHEPVPLALFPHGCIYRNRAIHALEKSGLRWRIAYTSQSLAGIQAAVSSGLGFTILPHDAILADHRRLGKSEGFAPLLPTELALMAPSGALREPVRRLADFLEKSLLRK